MASKKKIRQYALDWFEWYPNTSEADIRTNLQDRFLGKATPQDKGTAAVMSSLEGMVRVGHPVGCLAGLFLAPWSLLRRWLFPVNVAQIQADIDAVMSELQAEGRWASLPP